MSGFFQCPRVGARNGRLHILNPGRRVAQKKVDQFHYRIRLALFSQFPQACQRRRVEDRIIVRRFDVGPFPCRQGLDEAPGLLQHGLKFGQLDRFADVIVHAGREAFLTIAFQRVGGHGDDVNGRALRIVLLRFKLADQPRGFVSVQVRHVAIHQHNVVRNFFQRFDRFNAIGNCVG